MCNLGLQLEQEIGVEIVIFGFCELVAGKAADRFEIVPQREHLHMDDIAVAAVKTPGAAIAFRRAIVGETYLGHQPQIFLRLVGGDSSVPASCNHLETSVFEVPSL